MKKYFSVSVCLVLLAIMLVGCGSMNSVNKVYRPSWWENQDAESENLYVYGFATKANEKMRANGCQRKPTNSMNIASRMPRSIQYGPMVSMRAAAKIPNRFNSWVLKFPHKIRNNLFNGFGMRSLSFLV